MNQKIVIASILKPVDDVRAFWKIAQSLAKTNKYGVNIIGNEGKKESGHQKIHFHPHRINRNQFIKRILLRYRALRQIISIKPSVVIVTTHELLTIAALTKVLLGCKIIYDVQENYYLNASMHGFFGRCIGLTIRLKEILSTAYVSRYWLAEACYRTELRFARKGIVVTNKAIDFPIERESEESMRALFSGTLSEYTGVKEAISMLIQLTNLRPSFEAKIVGQVHDPKLEEWIRDKLKNYPNVKLAMSKNPIPYDEILASIAWANLGIIAYQPNKVNRNKMPTKLYEYSRYCLPYIVQEHTTWSAEGLLLGGVIPVNLKDPDFDRIQWTWENRGDLFSQVYPSTATWESEESKILDSI